VAVSSDLLFLGWGFQEVDEPWRTDLESIYAKGNPAIHFGPTPVICLILF
jgi:hypothetical protein